MSTPTPLDPEQIAAMLRGGTVATAPRPLADKPAKEWQPRYYRCDGCRQTMALLFSFGGNHDWEPYIGDDDVIRGAITYIRKATGQRTINLCCHCIDRLRTETPQDPPTESRIPTLFD